MTRLAGKVAFITGAGTGIGRATAILFAREGARVAIAEIDAAAGEETAHLAGNNAIAIRTDVTDEASVQAAIRTTDPAIRRAARAAQQRRRFDAARQHRGRSANRGILARHQARSVRHVPGLPRSASRRSSDPAAARSSTCRRTSR